MERRDERVGVPKGRVGGAPKRVRLAALALAAALAFPGVGATVAQDYATLVRMLHDADDFRVRVQAAFALGNSHDALYRGDLERALRDRNEAVRAAAATALGRLGSQAAVPALERARRDASTAVRTQADRALAELATAAAQVAPPRSPTVPASTVSAAIAPPPQARAIDWNRIQAVVVVGSMHDRSGFRGGSLVSPLREEIAAQLAGLDRVAFFPSGTQLDAATRDQIARRHLPMVRMDGNLVRVATQERPPRDLAVRCEVSLTLLDEPSGNLRGMMQGAATGVESREADVRSQEARLARQALAGAVRSAMSSAGSALARVASR
ncbi:MAG: HEAT repeat domain-containing protein [Polyangiales bacterium]